MEFFVLLAIAALVWLWHDSLRAREAAVRAARAACAAEGLLFLDDTVGIASIRPARDDEGRARIQRVYEFEYSDTGDNRIKGSIVLLGDHVTLLNVGLRGMPPRAMLH